MNRKDIFGFVLNSFWFVVGISIMADVIKPTIYFLVALSILVLAISARWLYLTRNDPDRSFHVILMASFLFLPTTIYFAASTKSPKFGVIAAIIVVALEFYFLIRWEEIARKATKPIVIPWLKRKGSKWVRGIISKGFGFGGIFCALMIVTLMFADSIGVSMSDNRPLTPNWEYGKYIAGLVICIILVFLIEPKKIQPIDPDKTYCRLFGHYPRKGRRT